MPLCEWEKTITCSYNTSHQITMERIQWHLVKCRKNHPISDHVVCPYNASHHVSKPEEQYHISTCEDRKIVERDKYSWAMDRAGHHGHLTLPTTSNINWGNSASGWMLEENWEKEATFKHSYDPSKKASIAPVLRNLQGATHSQRKEFRAQEKVRIETLQVGLDDSMSLSMERQQEEEKKNATLVRPAMLSRDSAAMVGPLRRPTVGGQSDGASSRQGSVTSALLGAHLGRGDGQPGQLRTRQHPGLRKDTNTTMEMNISKDTQDGVDTTPDTGPPLKYAPPSRGRGVLQQIPLRRPSGMGKFDRNCY